MATVDAPFYETVPLSTRRHLAASVCFRVPFYREYVLWSGCVDARRSVAEKVGDLKRGGLQSLICSRDVGAWVGATEWKESGDPRGGHRGADAIAARRPHDLRQEAQGTHPLIAEVRRADRARIRVWGDRPLHALEVRLWYCNG
ncbi:unnamed protein product [Phytophthora fragariaefolia]|uniref:Unnamed protein product n=1 Tax=Phytophthora fragariaefolia TaxID=1490495 RepID=A0A9W6XJ40_9STRA|nr:unnamed protein product [Phytophthora fragariaefolia]